MLHRFSRRSRGWAALAVGALVASLLAVSATTATATTDRADETSDVTACLGEAKVDQGFTDVPESHTFHESINCLAHYRITIGTGDGTTFSPGDPVKRWQMMLFLARALDPAGINLSRARAQNFTDLGNLNDETRDAIDLLVTNGIATAASSTTFDPNAVVDRTEMALLLVRFLDAAGDVVDIDSNGEILLDANDDGIQTEPDDYFEDARDQVPAAADRAISAAYELGITTGDSPTPASGTAQPGLDLYYRPRDSVTRGQMAAFIIRTLGHTLARPKGLSAQYDGNEIRVSFRGADFEPVEDAPIDMFYIETDDIDLAFTSRDECDGVDFVQGDYLCEIDGSDLTTDDDGEVSLDVPDPVFDGTDTTVWVWTGDDGDEVDRRTDPVRLDIEPSDQARPAARVEISTPFRGKKARFGTTVTVFVQLQDSEGRDVRVGVDGDSPAEWELVEELLAETGTVDGITAGAGELLSRTPRTVRSDPSGRFRFSISVSDPNRASTGDSRTRTFRLVPGPNAPSTVEMDANFGLSSGRPGGLEVYYLEFSDAAADPEQAVVTVTPKVRYVNAPSRGSARNSVVVSAFDEYGAALASARASLDSDVAAEIPEGFLAIGRDGERQLSYSYDRFVGEVEILTVTVDFDGRTSTIDDRQTATAHVFWPVLTAASGSTDLSDGGAKKFILFGDTDRNEIIVDVEDGSAGDDWPVGPDAENPSTVPERVEYDSNDRFDVQGPSDTAPRPVRSIEDFEKALAEYLAVTPAGDTGTGACLEWRNYDPRRSRFEAEIRLWHTCPS